MAEPSPEPVNASSGRELRSKSLVGNVPEAKAGATEMRRAKRSKTSEATDEKSPKTDRKRRRLRSEAAVSLTIDQLGPYIL